MKGRIAVLGIASVIIGVVAGLVVFLWLGAGFSGHLDKVPFSEVHTFYNDGRMNVMFDESIRINRNLKDTWVDIDNVTVKVDPSLLGTAISASPEFTSRIFGDMAYYDARSVTVWVQDRNEKQQWENFLQEARVLRGEIATREIPYETVLP